MWISLAWGAALCHVLRTYAHSRRVKGQEVTPSGPAARASQLTHRVGLPTGSYRGAISSYYRMSLFPGRVRRASGRTLACCASTPGSLCGRRRLVVLALAQGDAAQPGQDVDGEGRARKSQRHGARAGRQVRRRSQWRPGRASRPARRRRRWPRRSTDRSRQSSWDIGWARRSRWLARKASRYPADGAGRTALTSAATARWS